MDQLLVALDVDTADTARELARTLRGSVGGVKIGSRLFTAEGPGLVRELVGAGHRVFLDLKFHDIPSVVSGAVDAATRLGVWMLTVHAGGGRDMLRAAHDGAATAAARAGVAEPMIVAVTILTSLDKRDLTEIGFQDDTVLEVQRLARLAQTAGVDGVVTSPHEIGIIRSTCGPQFTIVTPGIRPLSPPGRADSHDDQTRTMTAADAIRTGANYIVVGRPIIAAPDPRVAAERIASELREAAAPRLTLYSRAGCHLCEDMKAVIESARTACVFTLDEVDISGKPDLERLYGEQIPVLLIDGRKAAKYRISRAELLEKLRRSR